MKRFFCVLLAALMLLPLSPAALAAEDGTTETIEWVLRVD